MSGPFEGGSAGRAAVWKIGSSVLRDEGSLPEVAEAIRRQAAATPLLVVVSAFAGVTDRLLAAAGEALAAGRRGGSDRPERGLEECVAGSVATGETAAASRVALAVAATGIPVALGEPRRLLALAGDRLDARPASVDAGDLARLLERARVAVVPGFFGESEQGGVALLGRGGSDLSALLFARALGGAACRLVKDVDGVYERDPAESPAANASGPEAPAPRRFRTLSYATAARVAGRLVQPKAIRFARTRRIAFEVGALGEGSGTKIGPFADVVEEAGSEEACA